jgi:hypothetical protein
MICPTAKVKFCPTGCFVAGAGQPGSRAPGDAVGADWRDVARVVLHLNPDDEFDRARRAFDSHLSRAKWMTEHGYRHLLRGGASV